MIGEWKHGGSSLLSLIGMGNSARTAVPSRCSGWFGVWKSAWGDLLGMLNKESHHYLWSGKSILISVNILLLSFLSSAFWSLFLGFPRIWCPGCLGAKVRALIGANGEQRLCVLLERKCQLKNAAFVDFLEWELYKNLLSKCKYNEFNVQTHHHK